MLPLMSGSRIPFRNWKRGLAGVAVIAWLQERAQAVAVGSKGQVLYRSRIDDLYGAPGKKRATPTRQDLREALDAMTAGKGIKNGETKAVGCLIK